MSGKCGDCKADTKSDNSLKCDGTCDQMFHYKCIGLEEAHFQSIENIQGLKWFCLQCEQYIKFAINLKAEMTDFKRTIVEEINKLKVQINGVEKPENKINDTSYAKVVTGEALVIRPVNKQEVKKTQDTVKKNLKPSDLEVGITQFKGLKDGGVLIKCKTKEEIEKVKKTAEKKLGKKYVISIPEQKNPCIKVLDFEDNLQPEKLVEYIVNQNTELKLKAEGLKIIAVKRMKTRYMAIIECDPEFYNSLMDKGSLNIGWTSNCRVFDYTRVFRCFKCGGFNHKADECNSELCGKCGESGHEKDNCDNPVRKRCVNCIYANEKLKQNVDVNHSVFDYNCPVYKQKVLVEKQKIRSQLG